MFQDVRNVNGLNLLLLQFERVCIPIVTHYENNVFGQEGHHLPKSEGACMPMYLSFQQLEPELVSSLSNLAK